MDEIIVKVCRAIACTARLRILSRLASVDEVMPTRLADELDMLISVLSVHLKTLSAAGLIQRRRSGVRCYCMALSPYGENTLSGRITAWLRGILAAPKQALRSCGVRGLRGLRPADVEAELHNIVFGASTAFTNVRRLQTLRRLTRGDTVAVPTLTRELSMSGSAVSRHTDKLIRRGYVEIARVKGCAGYRLASKFKTPIHAEMFEIVRSQWEEK